MADALQAHVVDGDETASPLTRREAVSDRIEKIRDDLYMRAAINQLAAVEWARIEPGQREPPEDWVESFGLEKAREMLEIAKHTRMPTKDAPVGIRMNMQLLAGLESARANRTSIAANNVQIIMGPEAPPLPSMLAPKAGE